MTERKTPDRHADRNFPGHEYRDRRDATPATAYVLPAIERRIWHLWNALPETCPNPVRQIAAMLAIDPTDVAFVVYPAETFGAWSDDDETGTR